MWGRVHGVKFIQYYRLNEYSGFVVSPRQVPLDHYMSAFWLEVCGLFGDCHWVVLHTLYMSTLVVN